MNQMVLAAIIVGLFTAVAVFCAWRLSRGSDAEQADKARTGEMGGEE